MKTYGQKEHGMLMPRQGCLRCGCLVSSRHGMLMPRLGCLVTASLSCSVTARCVSAVAGVASHGAVVLLNTAWFVNAAAWLSSCGAFVLFSHGTVC